MASDVEICNLSLGHLGDEAIVQSISPPDGTTQAQYCAQFYKIARDKTLEMFAWGFAKERKALALLSNATTATWPFQYQIPSDMIKPLFVLPADADYPTGVGDDDNKQFFKIEGSRILTNTENAILVYIKRIEDPTQFTPLFTSSFAYVLASYLSGPIIKGTTGRSVAKAMLELAKEEMSHATASDGNVGNYKPEHQSSWHRARDTVLSPSKHSTRWGR